MRWIKSEKAANGDVTIYPPQPEDYNKIPKCSQCGGLTQFLHFYAEILALLSDEAEVPSFCSYICAKQYVVEVKAKS